MNGIYLHIPFCIKKCPYCDFYSQSANSLIPDYVSALKNQIYGFSKMDTDSIYIGGGTPSLLSAKQLKEIICFIRKRLFIFEDCEITLEVNPNNKNTINLHECRDAGINRLSVGVQSLSDSILKTLGRLHNADDALTMIKKAKKAGFDNINADLMLAVPGQDEAEIEQSIEVLADSGVKHISVYLLKISEGTPFFTNPPEFLPDDDLAADLYWSTVEHLKQNGYKQYEISNFSADGYESRHNMKYWNCEDYIGIGAAAHSSICGKRYSFPPDIYAYLNYFSNPSDNLLKGLRPEGDVDWKDYLMLQLRTKKGLSQDILYKKYSFCFNNSMIELSETYKEKELLVSECGNLSLTTKGMLVSNTIIAGFLAAAEKNESRG